MNCNFFIKAILTVALLSGSCIWAMKKGVEHFAEFHEESKEPKSPISKLKTPIREIEPLEGLGQKPTMPVPKSRSTTMGFELQSRQIGEAQKETDVSKKMQPQVATLPSKPTYEPPKFEKLAVPERAELLEPAKKPVPLSVPASRPAPGKTLVDKKANPVVAEPESVGKSMQSKSNVKPERETKIQQSKALFEKTVSDLKPEAIEKFGKISNPNVLGTEEVRQLIDIGNKLLELDAESYKNLSYEEKSQMLKLVRARTIQLQMGEKVAAGIGENRKATERAIAKFSDKELIDKQFGPKLKQLDDDLKSLEAKYGFIPGSQKDRLTKSNKIFANLQDEIELREMAPGLNLLLTRKGLSSEQKATFLTDSRRFCDNFVNVLKIAEPETRKEIINMSRQVLQKIAPNYLNETKKQIAVQEKKNKKLEKENKKLRVQIKKFEQQHEKLKSYDPNKKSLVTKINELKTKLEASLKDESQEMSKLISLESKKSDLEDVEKLLGKVPTK